MWLGSGSLRVRSLAVPLMFSTILAATAADVLTFSSVRLDPGTPIDARAEQSRPASEPERMRIHRQTVLRINGTLPNASALGDVSLQVSLFIRGARWRTSLHRLCTSLKPDPQTEWRDCSAPPGHDAAAGRFEASVFVLVPGYRPRFRPQRRKGRRALLRDAASNAELLRLAAKVTAVGLEPDQ